MAMVFMELQETLLTKFCVCSLIVFLTSCQKNNVEHFIENEIKLNFEMEFFFLIIELLMVFYYPTTKMEQKNLKLDIEKEKKMERKKSGIKMGKLR